MTTKIKTAQSTSDQPMESLPTKTFFLVEYTKVEQNPNKVDDKRTFIVTMGFENEIDCVKFKNDMEFTEFLSEKFSKDYIKPMDKFTFFDLMKKNQDSIHEDYTKIYGPTGRNWEKTPIGVVLSKVEKI